MGIITLVTLISAGAGAYMLSKAIPNFQPGNKKIQADLRALKDEVLQLVNELVPIDLEELELFSHDQVNQSLKKGMSPKLKGVYTSIYHEPIFAYGMKKYVSSKNDNAILFGKTAKHEFYYRIKKGEVTLVIDNQLIGTIRENGVLYGAKSKRMIAQLNRDQASSTPVIVKEREVASITNNVIPTQKGKSPGKRAFEFVKNDISKEETLLLLAFALLEFVRKLEV